MAIDVALLASVKAGGAPVLRLYRWSPACLSFGRNQPTRDRYDVAAAAARGIDLVRRPTGGQAVLHDDELTYAVIAPVQRVGKPRAAYAAINEALVDGLRRLGVPATMAGADLAAGVGARGGAGDSRGIGGTGGTGGTGAPDWDAACFRRPERGEVVVGGAKLVGSAQRMEARTILQHGSILVGGTQAPAEELLVADASRPRGGTWTTLERELAGRPAPDVVAEGVRAGFEAVLGIELEPGPLTVAERALVERERVRFASDEWTGRR
jgi:lipoate-protein ligase A